jgi:hypothetical protein
MFLISLPNFAKFPLHQDEGCSALTNLPFRGKVVSRKGMWLFRQQS